jgi:riboflavin kinase/FMN adenylyltransferase
MQPVTIKGTVTRFNGKGRQLGYPTANLTKKTVTRDGVYFGFSDLAGFSRHPSMIFVGTPTTLGDKGRRVEAYLLDIPDKDYYDQPLSVTLEHYHRPNQTFPSIDELLVIMKADEAAARKWFSKEAP